MFIHPTSVQHQLITQFGVSLQIGTHVIPIRFSTGNRDPMFTIRAHLLPTLPAQLLYLHRHLLLTCRPSCT